VNSHPLPPFLAVQQILDTAERRPQPLDSIVSQISANYLEKCLVFDFDLRLFQFKPSFKLKHGLQRLPIEDLLSLFQQLLLDPKTTDQVNAFFVVAVLKSMPIIIRNITRSLYNHLVE
jgi:hypothetical protein